jgi:HEAT repeat protein
MGRRSRLCVWVVLGLGLVACAGNAAQGRVVHAVERADYAAALRDYEQAGHSPAVLRVFSETLLLRAARSSDPAQSRSAFLELSLLGKRASSLLERLAAPAQPSLVRAEALSIRTALGDSGARSALRALLRDPDADVVDRAYAALEPDSDWPELERALSEARPARRRIVLQLLVRAEPTHLTLLQDVSQRDPVPSLRAAALWALERYGSAAAPAFLAASRDPDEQVRVAALEGYARVAPDAASQLLDQQLGAASTSESIAAARALLRMQPAREPERAHAALAQALTSADPTLRARAAAALVAADAPLLDRATLRERLGAEPVHSVRLTLALALGSHDPAAHAALLTLSQTASLTGVEASAELAKHEVAARTRLRALTKHTTPLVRATAARMLGRELHEYASIAQLLADASWQVRQATAGAVLTAL